MAEGARAKTKEAERIIHELVVVQGLSYADVVKRAERLAEEKAAPYNEAAEVVRDWLRDLNG